MPRIEVALMRQYLQPPSKTEYRLASTGMRVNIYHAKRSTRSAIISDLLVYFDLSLDRSWLVFVDSGRIIGQSMIRSLSYSRSEEKGHCFTD